MLVERARLELELARWRRAGQTAVLWWRDDDARAPTRALRRLLGLAEASGAPLALAVVPDDDPMSLAPLLAESGARVAAIQHGVDHVNRRPGAVAGEFAAEATREEIALALREAWGRMKRLPGAVAVFTPPWNDIHPALPGALRAGRYLGLSGWGQLTEPGEAWRIDAHLDLMRWKKGARFRGEARLWAALHDELARRRAAGRWDAPIGLLTHHLAHDEAAWAFLERFLAWSTARPEFAWAGVGELFRVPALEAA